MAILGVDDFKSKLRGGGARPNLFKATLKRLSLPTMGHHITLAGGLTFRLQYSSRFNKNEKLLLFKSKQDTHGHRKGRYY